MSVQEGQMPLVDELAENTSVLQSVVNTLQQGLTYTTTGTVHLAAPTPPSQNNG